jgi:predicted ferric reductase
MTNQDFEDSASVISIGSLLLLLFAAIAGAFIGVVLLPLVVPGLSVSLSGPAPKVYWYLSRASGLVAYALIWLSVALGLLITNRLARIWPGGPLSADVHQFASLLGLTFAVFHGLILLGDHYINFTLAQLLVPFASSNYQPLWVGLGQIGFYLTLPLTFSFYVRKQIGYRAWRLIHYGSFTVFVLVFLHGAGSGTDTANPLISAMYYLTGGTVLFLTIYRILEALGSRSNAPRRV